jgi:murein DD-endopeptidase MepM/ murein hydrolase activator NlpD
MNQDFHEPSGDHLADTNPIHPVKADSAGWQRVAGLLSLLGAVALTIATVIVLISPASPSPSPAPATESGVISLTTQPTLQPDIVPTTISNTAIPGFLPTISPEQAQTILSAPLQAAVLPASIRISTNFYDPFTRIPDRQRSEVIEYEAVSGDSINSIAQRFGLKPETIAWSNDRRYVEVLRPGDRVFILPVDGVYHTTIGDLTIANIAQKYKVTPQAIIDSEYNHLFGVSPDTVLPSGTKLVIPGGQGEPITWTPTVKREKASGGAGGVSGEYITFAPGQAGSCGRVLNPGGGAAWVNPLPGATFVRGFSAYHTGVDLAAPVGTQIRAANGGRVIFAGWNDWGYGNTVVLAHGPFTTLYGHLSQVLVRCGQDVVPGQVIAAVGTTGNSSGPHLHFEIRYNDTPTDPAATIAF